MAETDRLTRIIGSGNLRDTEGVLLIRILSGELKGGEAIILGNAPFIVGASFEATLRLPDPSVSRQHLELVNKGGYVEAKDLGSTNGSFFEGTRFDALQLGPGSVFTVGQTELQIIAPGDSDPLPPSEGIELDCSTPLPLGGVNGVFRTASTQSQISRPLTLGRYAYVE